MSVYWSLNGTTFAEFDFAAIQGGRGLGFYRLIAQVHATTHAKQAGEEVSVIYFSGELWVRGKEGREQYLGHLRRQGAESALTASQYTSKVVVPLEIELDARRIEAIERIRLGGELFFRLILYGIASGGRNDHQQTMQASLDYRANQGTWIEILGQMDYQKTVLLEIPVPGDEISPQYLPVSRHLQTAQMHMMRGHFRDAVGACRDVMESLASALNDEKNELPGAIKSWFEETRAMDKEERLRIVRRALKVLTHPARHADDVSTSIEWGPTDARATIAMAAALFQLAAERRLG